jgi:lipooligosaccharide transport system ATP-binding protein
MNKPRVLILDEPTTGLDPQARHHVWAKLHELKSQGVTLILTTHYMDEAEQLCDELAIMDKGKIITRGSPWDLIRLHIPADVVEIRGEESVKREILNILDSKIQSYESLSDRLLLYSKNSGEIYRIIQDRKFPVKTVLTRRSTLEDVFLKLTGRELTE